jgi:hypothetical protein
MGEKHGDSELILSPESATTHPNATAISKLKTAPEF